jgi:hypothetical protein
MGHPCEGLFFLHKSIDEKRMVRASIHFSLSFVSFLSMKKIECVAEIRLSTDFLFEITIR